MAQVSFDERARNAIADQTLKRALAKATHRFGTEREHAMHEVDGEALRNRAQSIRDRTLAHLDQYLEQFTTAAKSAGMQVHWAKNANEANRIALELAASNNVKRVVKSKSMVTEEIGLNEALEKAGMEVTETDLGEWIVQLAGQPPSHIIAPAVHLTRAQVAALFTRNAGHAVADDIPSLTTYARSELRARFLGAEMGISGANFVVAETGTLVILTNEGNGRFVTGLPRLHVAIVGMEKVVPTWEELDVLLALLPRSASGQRISSYVNFVAGPRREGEADGPEEVHIILLDNGRGRLLGGKFQEALRCIRCGACLNVCPVYRQVGGHTYQSTYAGPIGSIITPLLKGLPEYHDLPHASSLCFACRDVCPVKIDLPRLLLELRKDEAEGKVKTVHWAERIGFALFGRGLSVPWLYKFASGIGRYAQRPLVRNGRIRSAPFPLSRWTRARDFPPLAAKPFRERWKEMQTSPHLFDGAHLRSAPSSPIPILPLPKSNGQEIVDSASQFSRSLERVGGHVYRAATAGDAREFVGRILRDAGSTRLIFPDNEQVRGLQLESLGAEFSLTCVPSEARSLRAIVQATDAALTSAEYAIAETGTLVLVAGPEQPRLLSALPALHIAVLRTSQIVPRFADLVPTLKQAIRQTSNVAFVTGPSRTGDIEQTITIGAHGPREVHVILLDF